jgi:hypothetical protein
MKNPVAALTAVLSVLFIFPPFMENSLGQVATSPDAVSASPAPALTIEQKFQHIEENGRSANPDQTPTEFTEKEINDYIASGKIKLPVGVQSVVLRGQPGVITGKARVDFDEIKTGRNSANPLLSVFNGIHNVVVVAQAYGAGGQGMVHVESVSLDDVEIPRFVLQMFVDKYLKPKYPNIGLDSKFVLPDRLDTASVGLHTLTVTQK